MADAVRGQLKANRTHAHCFRKAGAVQREAQVVPEPQEIGKRALGNEIKHRVIAQMRHITGRFVRGKSQIIQKKIVRAVGVFPILDDKENLLHLRKVVGSEVADGKIKAGPVGLVGNGILPAADQAMHAFELDLYGVVEIANAVAPGPKAEICDLNVFNPRGVARTVAQPIIKVGEVEGLVPKFVLADQRIPNAAKTGWQRVVNPQRRAVRAVKHGRVK